MSISSNLPGSEGVLGPVPPSGSQASGGTQTQNPNDASSVERSSRERLASELIATLMALPHPWIIPSNFASFIDSVNNSSSINGAAALSQLSMEDQRALCNQASLRLAEIATKVGEKWIENIKEVAAASKQHREVQAIYDEQVKVETQQKEITKQQVQASEILIASIGRTVVAVNADLNNFIQDKFQKGGSIDPGMDLKKVSAVVVGLVLAAGIGQQLTVAPVEGALVNAITPIQDASNQLAAYVFNTPQEMAAAVLTINLLVFPLEMMARTVAIKEGKGDKEAMDLANARWLASKLVLDVVGNELFASLLKSVYVATLPPGKEVDAEKFNIYKIKMTALALLGALLLLYKAEFGGVSGEELASVLKGEMKVPEEDIMAKIRNYLMGDKKMGTRGLLFELPQDERVAFLDQLLRYADTDPSFEKLKKPLINLHAQLFSLLPDHPEAQMI